MLEQGQREHEVDHDPGGQQTGTLLDRARLLGDRVNQVKVHDLGQLAQMSRRVDTFGYRDLAGDDTLVGQRDSFVVGSSQTRS